MMMLFMIALAFLPAFVIGEEEKTAAAAKFQAVCDFYAEEIERLEKNKKELKELVKLETVLYEKLNSSSGICNVIGYLALPECAIKKEGTKKEGRNVFDKLDDKCAEEKTNKITKSLKKVLGLGTEPTGQVVFRSCKDIFVKIILEQFKKMQGLISSQCDQSPSISPARKKRSYGGGYYPGGHDPSTIWFQYLLCHEQKISCYFFTQGWNEKDYGQYYLYENVLDTDLHSLGHGSSGTDDHLLTLLLLAGAGGSHQYPHQGYLSYKKRRGVEDDKAIEDTTDEKNTGGRRRRFPHPTPLPRSKAATKDTTDEEKTGGRRRRSEAATKDSNDEENTGGRRRRFPHPTPLPRSKAATKDTNDEEKTGGRRRRSKAATKDSTDEENTGGRRRRRNATTTIRKDEEVPTTTVPSRRRRHTIAATEDTTKDPEEKGERRRRSNAITEDSTKDPEEKNRRRRRSNDPEEVKCESIDVSC